MQSLLKGEISNNLKYLSGTAAKTLVNNLLLRLLNLKDVYKPD